MGPGLSDLRGVRGREGAGSEQAECRTGCVIHKYAQGGRYASLPTAVLTTSL